MKKVSSSSKELATTLLSGHNVTEDQKQELADLLKRFMDTESNNPGGDWVVETTDIS